MAKYFTMRRQLQQWRAVSLIRNSSLFDEAYYLSTNPDIASSKIHPLWHYVKFGATEGRNPCPAFNTIYYLEQNPDVAQAGINPLVHYILYGAVEGRKPHPEASPLALLDFKNQQLTSRRLLNHLSLYFEKLRKTAYRLKANFNERFLGTPISLDLQYQEWINQNWRSRKKLKQLSKLADILVYKPVFSIIIPTFNPPETFLRRTIDSVLGQAYPHWELCIADDASSAPWVKPILEQYAASDSRIKPVFRSENGHIAEASNSALALATGEFIALLDHDDVLTVDALYEVALVLNEHPEADMIYSDEDKVDQQGYLQEPFFKPDWCPDTFLSKMYTCHLGVYRKSLIEQIGGFRKGYEGAQDYDLVLRFTELTDKIIHIPKVLYHWRIHPSSTASTLSSKDYAASAAARAIADALQRRGETGEVKPAEGGHFIVRYHIQNPEKVSIIIPSKDLGDVLHRCLSSIFEKTVYPNFEVILVDNGSTEEQALRVFQHWQQREPDRFHLFPLNIPFNYPRLNNYGVTKASGQYVLLLNNDTEVITPDWLNAMVEQAQRPSIGAVGAKLLYPDDTIQHAGVIAGIGGIAGHSHKCFPATASGYFNQLQTVNNYSAVTAACLMCRREVFDADGGLDETLAVAFNDVDFCFRLLRRGYRNVWLPHVMLYHYESKSRGYETTPEKIARFETEAAYMKQKWQDILDHDPCYSPNLTRQTEDFRLRL